MLNHSCVPNTIPVLIGDRLVVRAATHIPEGGEVSRAGRQTAKVLWVASDFKQLLGKMLPAARAQHCYVPFPQAFTSYLGTQGGQPVSERTRALQASYGFRCNCARCKVSARQPVRWKTSTCSYHSLSRSVTSVVVCTCALAFRLRGQHQHQCSSCLRTCMDGWLMGISWHV
jgi:hypothetical protein